MRKCPASSSSSQQTKENFGILGQSLSQNCQLLSRWMTFHCRPSLRSWPKTTFRASFFSLNCCPLLNSYHSMIRVPPTQLWFQMATFLKISVIHINLILKPNHVWLRMFLYKLSLFLTFSISIQFTKYMYIVCTVFET